MKKNEAYEMLDILFRQPQMQFSNALRSRWTLDGDNFSRCGKEITAMKFEKKRAHSLNAFIHLGH